MCELGIKQGHQQSLKDHFCSQCALDPADFHRAVSAPNKGKMYIFVTVFFIERHWLPEVMNVIGHLQ